MIKFFTSLVFKHHAFNCFNNQRLCDVFLLLLIIKQAQFIKDLSLIQYYAHIRHGCSFQYYFQDDVNLPHFHFLHSSYLSLDLYHVHQAQYPFIYLEVSLILVSVEYFLIPDFNCSSYLNSNFFYFWRIHLHTWNLLQYKSFRLLFYYQNPSSSFSFSCSSSWNISCQSQLYQIYEFSFQSFRLVLCLMSVTNFKQRVLLLICICQELILFMIKALEIINTETNLFPLELLITMMTFFQFKDINHHYFIILIRYQVNRPNEN